MRASLSFTPCISKTARKALSSSSLTGPFGRDAMYLPSTTLCPSVKSLASPWACVQAALYQTGALALSCAKLHAERPISVTICCTQIEAYYMLTWNAGAKAVASLGLEKNGLYAQMCRNFHNRSGKRAGEAIEIPYGKGVAFYLHFTCMDWELPCLLLLGRLLDFLLKYSPWTLANSSSGIWSALCCTLGSAKYRAWASPSV